MRVIDLFCGAGGFSEGFRQAGFEVIWASDKWAPAVLTHQKNHPGCDTYLGDIEMISLLPDDEFHALVPDSEIIIGSPPCVAFSNSNKSGKGDKDLGMRLINAFLKIVARKKNKKGSILKYWVLENVPNSKRFIQDAYLRNELGEQLNSENGVYNAAYYGVPSRRKRFLCGNFPAPKEISREEDIIYLRDVLDALGKPLEKQNNMMNDPIYDFCMNGREVTDHHYVQNLAPFQWKKAKQLKQDKGYMGRMAFPEDKDRPARTVMATLTFGARESMIFDCGKDKYRAPTIREIASLMSFPIDYRFYGKSIGLKYKLVGNAVPPKLAYAFAKAIAIKERITVPEKYVPLFFSEIDDDFYNLNGATIPVTKEKPKRDVARFKYHIPYLIEKTYRVELTNYKSDFENKDFQWDVEIHKSQGPAADYFTLKLSKLRFEENLCNEMRFFIEKMTKNITNAGRFQEIYCQTELFRRDNKLTGPMEVLESVRSFLDTLEIQSSETIVVETTSNQIIVIPLVIAIGYFLLNKIISYTRGGK